MDEIAAKIKEKISQPEVFKLTMPADKLQAHIANIKI